MTFRLHRRVHLLALGGFAILLSGALIGCSNATAGAAHPTPTVKFTAGTTIDGQAAPQFSLHDQTGQLINLRQSSGHVTLLTFLDATCTTECPITAQYLDWTAQFLGTDSKNVAWLAMSVNPTNTSQQAETFMTENSVQVPLHILMGSNVQLAPLWHAYHISVQPTASGDVEHTLGLYLIDAKGHEREWVDGGYDPKALSADIEKLLHGA